MKTVANTTTLEIEVSKEDLFDGKWLNVILLSKKIGEKEVENNMQYKALRNKFYNSRQGGKYNLMNKAGIECIDVDQPMTGKASLEFKFRRIG